MHQLKYETNGRRRVFVAIALACSLVIGAAAQSAFAGSSASTPQSSVIRVDAGGSGVTGWSADTAQSPSAYLRSASPQQVTSFAQGIDMSDPSVAPGTPEELFKTERYQWQNGDDLGYVVPMPTGPAVVRLFFSENFGPAQKVGGRVMNVTINGHVVDRNLDVYSYVGANKALGRAYDVQSSGVVQIHLTNATGANSPTVKALEVVGTAPSTATATATATAPTSTTAQPTATAAGGSSSSTTPVTPVALTTRSYDASSDVIANPDRGFYHYSETNIYADGSGYTPLDPAQLTRWRTQEGVTEVFRYFYIEKYRDQDTIDSGYLTQVSNDFAVARSSGVKLIVRFAYVKGGSWPYNAPYGDASQSRVVNQIRQLAPVLNQNADVISVLQAGFIGLWGEWYYTDSFAHDPSQPGNLNDSDWAARRNVLTTLLDSTNANILVQVRYPSIKQIVFSGALANDARANRVGIHDDCFLASPDDYGTFTSNPISIDQQWLANQTLTVPMGGESCGVNAPRSQWPSASADMAKYHWSFLNADFDTNVLNSWGPDGLTQAKKSLGYRLRLTKSEVQTAARPGEAVAVSLNVTNDGYAAPFRNRPVQLVFENATNRYVTTLAADPRTWQPGQTVTASSQVCAPTQAGTYNVYLNLPDPSTSLAQQTQLGDKSGTVNAAYAIRLANTGTWDAARGSNNLMQTVQVTTTAQQTSSTCTK